MEVQWKKPLLTVFILALLAILLSLIIPKESMYRSVITANPNQNKAPENISGPQEVTLEGEIVCLPHRDTSGPTTLECAYGLYTDSGYYYALNATAVQMVPEGYEVGERVRIYGVVEEMNQFNKTTWETYNIVGIIAVTKYEKI